MQQRQRGGPAGLPRDAGTPRGWSGRIQGAGAQRRNPALAGGGHGPEACGLHRAACGRHHDAPRPDARGAGSWTAAAWRPRAWQPAGARASGRQPRARGPQWARAWAQRRAWARRAWRRRRERAWRAPLQAWTPAPAGPAQAGSRRARAWAGGPERPRPAQARERAREAPPAWRPALARAQAGASRPRSAAPRAWPGPAPARGPDGDGGPRGQASARTAWASCSLRLQRSPPQRTHRQSAGDGQQSDVRDSLACRCHPSSWSLSSVLHPDGAVQRAARTSASDRGDLSSTPSVPFHCHRYWSDGLHFGPEPFAIRALGEFPSLDTCPSAGARTRGARCLT